MSMTGIILAAVIVGGTGLFIGIFLGLADKQFAVEVDEKEEQIMPFDDTDIAFEGSDEKYTYEDLSAMTVKDIRKLAEDNGIMITKVIKDEVIGEFLSQQI